MLFVACYAIGVLLVIGVGSDTRYKRSWPESDVYVGSVSRAMLTVFQMITLENWAGKIVRPIMENDPLLTCMCLLAIALCSFGLLNVIIGVVVERTLVVVKENETNMSSIIQECEQRVLQSMQQEFVELASSSPDGEMDFSQFSQAIRTKSFRVKLKIIGLPLEDAEELFFLLDVDNSQKLSVDEFVAGVQKMKGPAQGGDMIQLLAFVQRAGRRATELQAQSEKFISQATSLLGRLDDVWGVTEAELHEREHNSRRKQELSNAVVKKEGLLFNLEEARRIRDLAVRQPKLANKRETV